MPKLRNAPVASAGRVPVELTDEANPTWATVEAAETFLDAQGLDIGESVEYGPVSRCKASGRAWATRAGLIRPQAWDAQALDLGRMRDLGIRAGWDGRAEGREYRTYRGIEFDDERREPRRRATRRSGRKDGRERT